MTLEEGCPRSAPDTVPSLDEERLPALQESELKFRAGEVMIHQQVASNTYVPETVRLRLAVRPAQPAPMTMTSYSSVVIAFLSGGEITAGVRNPAISPPAGVYSNPSDDDSMSYNDTCFFEDLGTWRLSRLRFVDEVSVDLYQLALMMVKFGFDVPSIYGRPCNFYRHVAVQLRRHNENAVQHLSRIRQWSDAGTFFLID